MTDIIVSVFFTSVECEERSDSSLIEPVTIVPHHPQTNGEAESRTQITKGLRKQIAEGDCPKRLARFLIT